MFKYLIIKELFFIKSLQTATIGTTHLKNDYRLHLPLSLYYQSFKYCVTRFRCGESVALFLIKL